MIGAKHQLAIYYVKAKRISIPLNPLPIGKFQASPSSRDPALTPWDSLWSSDRVWLSFFNGQKQAVEE